jgi:NADH dehydrogenase/NADH:ubiquinone oxidoreductase subunit G
MHGEDKVYPVGAKDTDKDAFKICAEKAPNARGVRRVLSAFGPVLEWHDVLARLGKGTGSSDVGSVILTGNYPSEWLTRDAREALSGKFVTLIDTLASDAMDAADIVLPGATFAEKAGTFENWRNQLQAFEQAIPVIEMAKSEGQVATDLLAAIAGKPVQHHNVASLELETTRGQVAASVQVATPRAELFNPANCRAEMAKHHPAFAIFATGVSLPASNAIREPDMEVVTL